VNAEVDKPQAKSVLLVLTAAMLLVAAVAGRATIRAAIGAAIGGDRLPPAAAATAQAPNQPAPGTYQWGFGHGRVPVTWGCATIRYRMVEAGAPPAAAAFVAQGLRRFTDASSGTFTFTPAEPIESWQQDTNDWHGITIGWADSSELRWTGQESGRGGASSLGHHLTHGDIWLRTGRPDGRTLDRTTAEAVLQQEIGHVVGLGHVSQDTPSIMTPEISTTTWSHADRQVLSYLGWYACRNSTP
jgi:hypothetical protein